VFSVEFVDEVPTHLDGGNYSLLDQASDSLADTNFRAPRNLGRKFSNRQRSTGASENGQYGAI
jgi:hypothetical protein